MDQPTHKKKHKDIRLEALADAYAILERTPGKKSDKCCEAFVKTIETGYWRPGDPVPTEIQIASVLPVSLGTVQVALRCLATDGIIKRTRGRGTVIATPRDPSLDPHHARFFDDDGKSLLRLNARVLAVDEIHHTGPWADFIGNCMSYIRITRHIDVSDEFTIYNEFYLEGMQFRPLLDFAHQSLTGPHLWMILHDRFNCPTLRFEQNIFFTPAEPPVAELFGIEIGERALVLEVMSYSFRDRPLSYQKMVIPPNDRKMSIMSVS